MKKLILLLLVIYAFGSISAQVPVVTNPANQTVTEGSTATFSITITSGTAPFTYQWEASFDQTNYVNISGANSLSYTTPATNLSMDGSWFRCIVSNDSGTTTSNPAVLTVNAAPPVILSQPVNQSVYVGETATFSVTASGSAPLSYKWYHNGSAISGAASPSYTTEPIQNTSFDGSVFYCEVTNAGGTIESENVTLSVSFLNERVTDGLQVLYDFNEGSGSVVNDISGVGTPLNLSIDNSNSVAWVNSGLNVNSEVRIKSTNIASKIINNSIATNEISFEAWILSTDTVQRDIYTRIMTLSNDNKHERNFALMQLGGSYLFNLRTSTTSLNGDISTAPKNSQELTHYVFTRDLNANVNVYINGNLVLTKQITGDFSNWDNGYFLYLGSEVADGNYWEGTYFQAAIYSKALTEGEVNQNYAFGTDISGLPFIYQNPLTQTIQVGQSVTFEVKAIGSAPISYQWTKNGSNIVGAVNSSYTTPALTPSENGAEFNCIVSSPDGNNTSSTAVITVLLPDSRVTQDIIAQYTFREGSGSVINDVSGIGTAVNLNINTPDAVTWSVNGLEINSEARIFSGSQADKIYDLCTISNQLTIETWIKPANITQTGPARIVTLSQDAAARNVTLSQDGDMYDGRLRTNQTNSNGVPYITSPAGTATTDLQHVVYVYREDGKALIFVNGVETVKTSINGDFSTWPDTYRLAFANELLDSRPWLGTFNYVAIFNRRLTAEEVLHNYNIGPFGLETLNAPSGLSATTINENKTNLAWSDNSSNEDGFIIERGSGEPIVWEELTTTGKDVNTFSDETVVGGTQYSYRCRGFSNFTGTYSEYSNTLNVISIINKPSSLVAGANEVGKVQLIWADNSQVETGFTIERGTGDPVVFSEVGLVGENIVNYDDLSVEEGVEYTYRVKATNSIISSEYSNSTLIRSKASYITAPSDLRSELDPILGSVVLNWVDNAFNELGYVIERRKSSVGSEFTTIDSVGMNEISFTDNSVSDSVSYIYRVFAYNNELVSEYSGTTFIEVIIVGVESENKLPKEYVLMQNYPNPFNPSTTISFSIPVESHVTITLHNLLGQELFKLVNKNFNMGTYSLTFNAEDLTSGIYIYTMVANGISNSQFTSSKKLILMK